MWAEVDGERKKVAWYVISLSLSFSAVSAFATSTSLLLGLDTLSPRFVMLPGSARTLELLDKQALLHLDLLPEM
jgi:hypothetical protein